jgi:adenylate cyclase
MATDADFEREGLLEGLDQAERVSRLTLLRQLDEAGIDMETMKKAAAEDRLAVLPIEHVFSRDVRYTLTDVLEQTGLSEEFIRRDYLALGLPLPAPDEPGFTQGQLEAFRALGQLFEAGFPEERVLDLARVYGRAAAQTAEATVDNFVRTFLRPGDTEGDAGLRFAQLAEDLAPTLAPLLETPVRAHIREIIRREVISRTEIMQGELPGAREVVVSFADIVGFTSLSAHSSAEEIGELTASLERYASEAAEPPVRLIKLIGDAAMLAAPDPSSLVSATQALVSAVDEDARLPQLRAGVAAGAALNRSGDWYGHAVNLASRLTGAAEPSRIFATENVATATGDAFRWEPMGTRHLKGIEEPVAVFALG